MPLIDIHTHTSRYSACSLMDPGELVEEAVRKGLDGVIITEHGRVWPPDELAELGSIAGGRVRIFSGQEVRIRPAGSAAGGDVLVFGCDRVFPRGISSADLVEAVHVEGGVAVAAHPFRGSLGLGMTALSLPLDGIEVLSGNCLAGENDRARDLALKGAFAALGGSDAHAVEQVGVFTTFFEEPVESMGDVVRLIAGGRVRPVKP